MTRGSTRRCRCRSCLWAITAVEPALWRALRETPGPPHPVLDGMDTARDAYGSAKAARSKLDEWSESYNELYGTQLPATCNSMMRMRHFQPASQAASSVDKDAEHKSQRKRSSRWHTFCLIAL